MLRSLYTPLVRILMVLQWASSASLIVGCWLQDLAPTRLHYCLVLMATVCVLMSFGALNTPAQPLTGRRCGQPNGRCQ